MSVLTIEPGEAPAALTSEPNQTARPVQGDNGRRSDVSAP